MHQIAVRTGGPGDSFQAAMLTNEAGEVTSHIQGMFNRTIKMMTSGIKPMYVFDGKPPNLKGGELAKRLAKRKQAEADLENAKENGEIEDVNKFSRRLVKVTKQHNEDCKELLRLMGVPYLDAPCEAEAQCAELTKSGKVYATATEDMDALTFNTPILLRKLTFSTGQKQPIIEININLVLKGLDITYEQFVDMCILCGCDYCDSLKGIGPKTALKLIKQYKTIEKIVVQLEKDKKHEVPDHWKMIKSDEKKVKHEITIKKDETPTNEINGDTENHIIDEILEPSKLINDENKVESIITTDTKEEASLPDALSQDDNKDDIADSEVITNSDIKLSEETSNEQADSNTHESAALEEDTLKEPLFVQARSLFITPDVTPGSTVELCWKDPDEEGLRQFLVERMGFNLERVNTGIKKLKDAQQKKAQKRMDWYNY